MSNSRVDHIVVVAPSLEAGGAFIQRRLGVQPQQGGEHVRMGTHNLVLRLGDTMYLEVISINPQAPSPPRPRWFELDRLSAQSEPRLACWVARTTDLPASLAASSEYLGHGESMSRGSLEWSIAVPEDGSLPLNGAAPHLIQWNTVDHPASHMQDHGCRLVRLELFHPEPKRLQALLDSLHFAEPAVAVSVETAQIPGLVAHIETPQGLRSIGTS